MRTISRLRIDEIAALAGVSKTTVSRVLNKRPDVKRETRERIMAVVEECGFKPNALAKAVALRKSHMIGLISPYGTEYIFSNPFYSEIIHGVSTETKRQGYYLMFCFAHENDYIDIYQQGQVDGFVLLSPGTNHTEIVKKLHDVNAPFVSTTKIPSVENYHYVDIDNFYAATLAVEHLVSLGHRRIAIINSFNTLACNQDRLAGYESVLRKYNIEVDGRLIKSGAPTFENGYNLMLELINEEPTGVFVCSDMAAFGAIKAIRGCGKRVPEDISVIGFDDIEQAGQFDLTTIKQPIFQKGKCATKMLINLIENKSSGKSDKLGVELMVRKSAASVGR